MNESDDVTNLVNQVLRSPDLRGAVENCILQAQQQHVLTPAQPEINSPSLSVRTPSQNLRQELNRLFPTIRRNNTNECRRVGPSKKKKSSDSVFYKEVILVRNSTNSVTLKGKKKSLAYENGFALSDVPFYTNWTEVQILQNIENLFSKFLQGKLFEIMVPIGGQLVKPNLPPGRQIEGRTLKSMFAQKIIYVRPLQSVSDQEDIELDSEIEELDGNKQEKPDLVEDECELEINKTNDDNPGVCFDDFQFEQDIESAIENSLNNSYADSRENHFHTETNSDNNKSSSLEENSGDLFESTSFKELLDKLQQNISTENLTKINVYRPDIFSCCVRALQRASFLPHHKIDVIFTDCDNTSEGAIDAGGPSREMFRLVFNYFITSSLFTGPCSNKFISNNKELLENNHYFIAGQLTALGIVHCGFGPRCFSQLFFSLLVEGPENIHPTLDDLTEEDIKKEVCMAMDACDLQALRNIIYEGTFIRLAGWEQVSVLEKKDKMIKDVIKFYVLDRCLPSLDQFKKGLETLNIHGYIKKYPEFFVQLLCTTEENALTLQKFEAAFSVNLSEMGSNKRQTESRILAYWRDYIIDCAENDEACSLEEILIFCTAVDVIPSAGFIIQPSIHFLHDDPCPYPLGNTCSLELHLPTIHNDYNKFKYQMTYGIKNGMVFGTA